MKTAIHIYQCCLEELVQVPKEISAHAVWCVGQNPSEAVCPPVPGELVSMGKEQRWQVVEVLPFQAPDSAQNLLEVYLVQVHLKGLAVPPRKQWACNYAKEDYPNESIFLNVTGDGLQLGFDMRGLAPSRGERLMSYESTEHPTLMRPIPRPWIVDRVDAYLPTSQSPYTRIDLAWCVAAEEAIAV
jgi:hypothetical protein